MDESMDVILMRGFYLVMSLTRPTTTPTVTATSRCTAGPDLRSSRYVSPSSPTALSRSPLTNVFLPSTTS
jgi:hypothetical protein